MNEQLRLALLLAAAALPLGCGSAPAPAGPAAGISVAAGLADLPVEPALADIGTEAADGETAPRRPTLSLGLSSYQPWHLEFADEDACKAFAVPGVHVLSRFQKWADLLLPVPGDALQQVARSRGLVRAESTYPAITPPQIPAAPAASRATPELTARGGLAGLKGKGVVVAVVDSGLDFRHPDFSTLDASGKPVSRILALWDTTSQLFVGKGAGSPGPIPWPSGAPLGTVFTRDQLTAELRTPGGLIGLTDANGHGTACASIAAGNGRGHANPAAAGVAPEADLVAVRIGGTSGTGLENVFLLGPICDWIEKVAAGRPYVVSCSLGGQMGGRDGQRVIERQLDARFPAGAKGRSLCIAAGNEGAQGLHASATCGTKEKPGRLEWQVHEGTQAQVTLYFGSATANDLFFRAASGEVKAVASELSPFTRHVSLLLGPTPAGSYALDLWTASGTPVPVDAYLSWGRNGPAAAAPVRPAGFLGAAAGARKQVATPGTTRQAVTVGSYDFNDLFELKTGKATYGNPAKGVAPLTMGALSGYSNPGPMRTGSAVKPELAAPGQFHLAALAQGTPAKALVEKTGSYWYMNGTSASTPYVAGVIALMLQKNPSLTHGEIRSLLVSNLSKDAFTGPLPNPGWGHGKLDLKAVRAVLAAVKAP